MKRCNSLLPPTAVLSVELIAVNYFCFQFIFNDWNLNWKQQTNVRSVRLAATACSTTKEEWNFIERRFVCSSSSISQLNNTQRARNCCIDSWLFFSNTSDTGSKSVAHSPYMRCASSWDQQASRFASLEVHKTHSSRRDRGWPGESSGKRMRCRLRLYFCFRVSSL